MQNYLNTKIMSDSEGKQPKRLALFSAPCKYIDDALALIKRDKFLEWDLNTMPFSLSLKRMAYVRDFINEYGDVRFHLPYGFWDLGVKDSTIANDSYNYYCRLFETINFLEKSVAVIHIGSATGSDEESSINGLTKLVDQAKKYGVKLCIENLIHGLSSDISFIKSCLQIDGLFFCLDTGHAEFLRRKNGEKIYDDIFSLKDKILHAHVYDVEDDNMNHVPFTVETIKINKWIPLLDSTSCDWYTMELDFQNDQDTQKAIMEKYLITL